MQFAKLSRQKFPLLQSNLFLNSYHEHIHTQRFLVIIKCNNFNKFDILMNEICFIPHLMALHNAKPATTMHFFLFAERERNAYRIRAPVCVCFLKSHNFNFHRVDFALIMPSGYLFFPFSNGKNARQTA